MYVYDLVDHFRSRNISLFLDDGALRYKTPTGALTPDDLAVLRSNREEILTYLRAVAACGRDPIPAGSRSPPVASLTQQMWWDWVGKDAATLQFEQLSLVVESTASPAHAERAIRRLIERHETLRSHFNESDGRLSIAAHRPSDFRIETAVATQAGADGGLDRVRKAFFASPIGMSDPWLTRAAVVDAGPSRTVAMLRFHHSILDGLTLKLLHDELRVLLDHPPEAWPDLEAEVVQSSAYAAWERDWFEQNGGHLLAFWRQHLAPVPPLRRPSDGLELVWVPGSREEYDFSIDAAKVAEIEAFRDASGAPALFLFLSALAVAIRRWSGQGRFSLRTIGDLRTTFTGPDIAGYLVCSDVVRCALEDGDGIEDVIGRVAAEYQIANRFRMPSLFRLPGHPDMPEGLDVSTRIAATVNYINVGSNLAFLATRPEAAEAPLRMSCAEVARSKATESWPVPLWPIYLRLFESEGGLFGKFEFNASLIERDLQIALMSEFFQVLSEQIAAANATDGREPPTGPKGDLRAL